jgi:riboflavin kinase/FMN adenylyltransferase
METINFERTCDLHNPVVTVGTFDGVHQGHRKVIAKVVELAKEQQGTSVAVTFWPHPRLVVDCGDFKLLSSLEEKQRLLQDCGVDCQIVLPFTKEFAAQSSWDFVSGFLVKKLGVKTLVVGYDHHFGKSREGKFETLGNFSREFGFDLVRVDPMNVEGTSISSTRIRNIIASGNMDEANRMLGYNYSVEGIVIDGFKLGRKLGFPTANLGFKEALKVIPPVGIYAVRASLDGKTYDGMMSIGYRPTVVENPTEITYEVHLFDFDKDIYNYPVSISFVTRMRDEVKFASLGELKDQMEKDKIEAQKRLK